MAVVKEENFQIATRLDIDNEMYNRWPSFINLLNQGLKDCGIKQVASGEEVKKLFYDPVKGEIITNWFLYKDLTEASFLPDNIGALAFSNSTGVDWFFDWLVMNSDQFIRRNKYWFVNIAFTQLFSFVTNPFAKSSHLEPKILNLADIILKSYRN
ncbi:hypothetical protein [Shouchella patagoniensis]|uniref:hypothetical protein n=1 Tax=Shouchella patagoniensis TaxID=228576 RepID=UPI0009950DAF|nr:hypothetical protein [Shouchella patagoniensis]